MSAIFIASYAVLWVLVVVMAVLLLLVYRHFGLIAVSTGEGHDRDGLPLGRAAPSISGVNRDNTRLEWTPSRGRHTLLVFALPGCEPCEQIAAYLGPLGRKTQQLPFDLVVAATGRGDAVQALEQSVGAGVECIGDDGSGAMRNYEVKVTPFAFVLDIDGKIVAKGNCSTAARLRQLLMKARLEGPTRVLEEVTSAHENNNRTTLKLANAGSDTQ